MSITKNQLKTIVKECLLEILSEGIGASAVSISESKKPSADRIRHSSPAVHQQIASKTKFVNKSLDETIRREAGGNKIMAEILADTAATSLPAMIENDRRKIAAAPSGPVERVVANHSPEQLFGEEVASRWESLAFLEPKK